MPIYEFKCQACGNEYEELLFDPDEVPDCPACGSAEVERLLSHCAYQPKIEGPDFRALKQCKTPEMLKDTKLLEKLKQERSTPPEGSDGGSGGCPGCS